MALITCPECGREVSSFAEACPGCGYPIAGEQQPRRRQAPTERHTFKELGGVHVPPKHNPRVGEAITLGTYKGERMAWRIAEIVGDKAFVIADKAIASKPYNDEQQATTWEECTLRAWLNGEFLAEAFSEAELSRILPTDIVNRDSRAFDVRGGADTRDAIFILDPLEAERYFESDKKRACAPSAAAIDEGVDVSDANTCSWWLRMPGSMDFLAAFVFAKGSLCERGNAVDAPGYGVRPAMWISL